MFSVWLGGVWLLQEVDESGTEVFTVLLPSGTPLPARRHHILSGAGKLSSLCLDIYQRFLKDEPEKLAKVQKSSYTGSNDQMLNNLCLLFLWSVHTWLELEILVGSGLISYIIGWAVLFFFFYPSLVIANSNSLHKIQAVMKAGFRLVLDRILSASFCFRTGHRWRVCIGNLIIFKCKHLK